MRILLVVNSFASSVTARNTVVVHRRLSRAHDVDVVETNRRGHATRFAQDAARRGLDLVVAFGGDGTLNEVVNGIAGSSTALGVLPGGSTNVFARTIGLPNDPEAAVDALCEGLDAGLVSPIGLGRVDDRYFCFHTGIGFDAAVVEAVERRASLKRWLGHPLFVSAAISTWSTGYDRSRPHYELTTDDGRTVADGFFTVVLNTDPYTYLGNRPLGLSSEAGLERPLVAVTFRTLDIVTILRGLGAAWRGAGVADGDRLVEWTDVRTLAVDGVEPFPYQVDGDFLGETKHLRFEHVPDAVRLAFPAR